MSNVVVQRKIMPIEGILIKLAPYEDQHADETANPTLTIREGEDEPECFTLKAEQGYQVLTKGELLLYGQAILELASREDKKPRGRRRK